MKSLKALAAATVALSLMITGCGKDAQQENKPAAQSTAEKKEDKKEEKKEQSPAEYTNVAKELIAELDKGKDGGKVDWAKVEKLYKDNLKALVEARDEEFKESVGEQLAAALQAGKDGKLSALTVSQLFNKLTQKVFFLAMRHDFKEANDQFKDKEVAKKEIAEAKEYYEGLLKSTVEKRDTAYGTQILSAIDGGFGEMIAAVEKGDNLAFNLGKQVVDKNMMRVFYLAAGGEKGYGYKIEKAVKEDPSKDQKPAQAEGWAFFQSIKAYMDRFDKDASDFINGQFDLSNDVKNISGDKINQAFVRGFAAIAKGEYKESFENWGKDKAVITALEGALFINVIEKDLPKALGGEAQAKALVANAGELLNAVKAGNKEKATELHGLVLADLEKLQKYGK
jgi:hypothetical protein